MICSMLCTSRIISVALLSITVLALMLSFLDSSTCFSSSTQSLMELFPHSGPHSFSILYIIPNAWVLQPTNINWFTPHKVHSTPTLQICVSNSAICPELETLYVPTCCLSAWCPPAQHVSRLSSSPSAPPLISSDISPPSISTPNQPPKPERHSN